MDGDLVTARYGRGGSSSTTHQRAQHGGCQAEVGKGTACVCSIDPSSSSLPPLQRAARHAPRLDCRRTVGHPGRLERVRIPYPNTIPEGQRRPTHALNSLKRSGLKSAPARLFCTAAGYRGQLCRNWIQWVWADAVLRADGGNSARIQPGDSCSRLCCQNDGDPASPCRLQTRTVDSSVRLIIGGTICATGSHQTIQRWGVEKQVKSGDRETVCVWKGARGAVEGTGGRGLCVAKRVSP